MKAKHISHTRFLQKAPLAFMLSMLFASGGFAQSANVAPVPHPIFTNPVFITLSITAVVLLAVIAALAATVKQLTYSGFKRNQSKSQMLPMAIGALVLFSSNLSAQAEAPVFPSIVAGLPFSILITMILVIAFEFLLILVLVRSINHLLIGLGYKQEVAEKPAKAWFDYWKKIDRTITAAVPLERESEVMTDHEYDGIRELDNNLPPWWVWGFYATIIFAVVYVFNYHVFRTAPSQLQEYTAEMEQAEESKKSYLAVKGASVDESNVTVITDAAMLTNAKEIYTGNCANCHGANGEGGVGPNLTDEFWLHGGGIQNVFKIIKYGVPEKGMISWQGQLKPEKMQAVASYILTLQGSTPSNAKAPQGEKWVDPTDSSAPADSDSTASAEGEALSLLQE
jgi:cytochrome c oxidase cbb3-type subunit 3